MYSPLFGLDTRFGGSGNPWIIITAFFFIAFLVGVIDGVGSSSGLHDDGEVDDEQQASQRDVK